MGLINRSIPNLYNGISQQPPSLRLPSQAAVQENALSSVVFGLSKRPPVKHVAKINSLTNTDSFIHTINRDASNQFVVVILNGDLKVYNLAGVEQTVSFPDGKTYLNATTPRDSFAAITVADYTFIVNKTFTVAQDAVTAGGTFKGSKQKFLDLPTSGQVDGDVWEIAGDSTNNFDNYYVKWVSASGVWRETVKPGLKTTLTATSMPFRLVNNGGGSFTFSKITWNNRVVGDDTSAPFPSFLGKQIFDVFFHRNRLGFIADENVVFSRAGDFFNFFPETTTAILDTDPVDVAVSHTKVAVLRHALAFNTSLMLFADQAQFQLTAKDNLTPKTATINVTTEYNIEKAVKPTSAGSSIFFAVSMGDYSGVKEYMVQPLTYTNEASDVTAHCPKYIPKNMFRLVASNLENVVVGLTLNERNAVYVYKYYWSSPEEKVQSSWSKFTLDSASVILNCDFIDTVLWMVVKRADGTYLESIDFQQNNDNLGFAVLLDHRVTLTGTYDSGNNWTTWTLPYSCDATYKAVLGTSFTGQEGTVLSLTSPTSTTLRATGNYSAGSVFIGKPYTMRYEFSPVYFKDDQKVAVTHYKIKLRNFELLYDTSGFFKVEVTPKNRDTYTYTYSGKTIGSDLVVGNIGIGTGKFKFPVYSDAASVKIVLTNDTVLPSTLQAAEWEGLMTTVSKHY